ncbi:hypothetical protein KRR38_20475 [Novosphingobium sp. G106]|uniref:hypothetical protein n=1 Tax=Novosphingobium sp. G106 TaxID=2849500 RepID=UPI001C2D3C46|nr:hypothetical protein [Novosphingobium sp. G106]MBV1689994.1 hypothetical protein [Novosphingobium sp. G106]
MILRLVPIALAAPLMSGCIASTAANLVTAPVRVASKGVDMMTTSQSESDEKRGRDLRHREERLGRLQRDYDKHTKQCMNGNEEACDVARADYGEMENLRATIPAPQR